MFRIKLLSINIGDYYSTAAKYLSGLKKDYYSFITKEDTKSIKDHYKNIIYDTGLFLYSNGPVGICKAMTYAGRLMVDPKVKEKEKNLEIYRLSYHKNLNFENFAKLFNINWS